MGSPDYFGLIAKVIKLVVFFNISKKNLVKHRSIFFSESILLLSYMFPKVFFVQYNYRVL